MCLILFTEIMRTKIITVRSWSSKLPVTLNSLFMLTTKRNKSYELMAVCEGYHSHSQRASNAKSVSKPWRFHVRKNVKSDVKYLRLDRRFPLWIRSDGNIWICIYQFHQTFTCLILFWEQKNLVSICMTFSLLFHHPGLLALLFACVFVRRLCSLIICYAHKTNPWFHDLDFLWKKEIHFHSRNSYGAWSN